MKIQNQNSFDASEKQNIEIQNEGVANSELEKSTRKNSELYPDFGTKGHEVEPTSNQPKKKEIKMSVSKNKIIIIGNLGQKPELKTLESGKKVTNLNIATNNKFGDKVQTDWHQVVCWGKLAEVVCEHLNVGSLVEVEGSLHYSLYEKEGIKLRIAKITASEVLFLSRAEKQDANDSQALPGEEDLPF